jgi:tRNA pseudouridine38-40 synthase
VRLRLDLSYDGTDFSGWAAQPRLRTVQGTLEAALATVLRVPEVRVTVAGRTDAGVHARGQVVHLDVDPDILVASAGRSPEPPVHTLVRRLNGMLPADLRMRAATEAPDGFDARFSAVWRRYAYRVADSPAVVDPLTRHHVLAWPRPLDVEAMSTASAGLTGLQDFAAFCKQREGATTVRTLLELSWSRTEAGVVEGRVVADAFCHNMVRALVGCLLAVGEGRRPATWPVEVLAGRRRDAGVTVVHPHGLTLEEVGYPDDDELAAQATRARARREAPRD